MDYLNYKNVLAHHGIKGQKWGVRRFQNPDGSLTPEGRERYGVGTGRSRAGSGLPKETENVTDDEQHSYGIPGQSWGIRNQERLREEVNKIKSEAITNYIGDNTSEGRLARKNDKYYSDITSANRWARRNNDIDVLWINKKYNDFLDKNKELKSEVDDPKKYVVTKELANAIVNTYKSYQEADGKKVYGAEEAAIRDLTFRRVRGEPPLDGADIMIIAERSRLKGDALDWERQKEDIKLKLDLVSKARNRLDSSYTGTAGSKEHLAHHGIKGQKWGVRNGPPYPLKAGAHSSAEERYLKGGRKAVSVAKSKAERKRLTEANSDGNKTASLKSGRAGLAPLSDTSKAEKDHILETGSMKDLKRFVKQHPGTVSANEYQQFFNRINLENSLKSKVAEERVDAVNRVSSMVGAVGDLADKGAKLYNVIAAIHNARAASAADRWKLLDTKNIQAVNNTISIAKENARKTLVKDASKEKTEGDKRTQKNEKALEKVQEADQKAGVKAAKKSAKQAEKELRSAQNQKVKDIYENARVQNEAYKVAKENSRKAIQRLASKGEVAKDVEEIEKSVVSRMKKEIGDRDSNEDSSKKGIFRKKKKK